MPQVKFRVSNLHILMRILFTEYVGEVNTSEVANMSHDIKATPTPGQLLVIESNSFTADKFVSKRTSKKWDVPPSDIPKKHAGAGKSFDATAVDPSEFVPKVVPMCEVESALGREGEGEGGGGEEGGEGGEKVVLIKQKVKSATSEVWM